MKLDYIGRYEVQRRLGAGGMGSLYLARDPVLERLVAIKLLKDDYREDTELRQRFLREARSVARLRHRNIVLVFDVGYLFCWGSALRVSDSHAGASGTEVKRSPCLLDRQRHHREEVNERNRIAGRIPDPNGSE